MRADAGRHAFACILWAAERRNAKCAVIKVCEHLPPI
jgi:hypothetical protein